MVNNNKELLEISTMDDVFHGFSPQSPLEDLQTSLETALHPEVSLDWDPGLEDGEMEACLRTFTNADRFENVGLPLDVGETCGLGQDSGPRPRGADERKSGRRCHPVKEIPRGRKRLARPASHDEDDEEEEEDEDEELQKNRKNAIAARLNRQRKKRYVEGLEVQVGDLEHEKQHLQNECEQLEGRVKQLEGEVVYLRSVLSNDSALAGLLNLVTCAGRTGLLKTHTSPRTNSLVAEHDYAGCGENKMSFRAECVDTVLERAERNGLRYPLTESETPKNGVSVGGLCLHVDRGLVSVELCAVCAQQAADLRKAKNIQE